MRRGKVVNMDKAQLKREKEARYEEYCETYEQQLKLLGYINSLEKDNENLRDITTTTNREKRHVKRLIRINDKDIKKYNKALGVLPAVPPFV